MRHFTFKSQALKTFSRAAVMLVLAAISAIGTHAANAAAVSAKMSLSQHTAEVGEAVQLEITVSGTQDIGSPQGIQVDGLDIAYSGRSSRYQMNNFHVTSSISLNYMVTPERAGKFVIPAQEIKANGKTLTTNSITLDVRKGNGGSGNAVTGNTSNNSQSSGIPDIASAELLVPKSSAYVGEAIPVELRIYFDDSAQVSLQNSQPEIKSNGFTMKDFPQPDQKQIVKNGKVYDVLIFKTAITPVKTGKLTIGPASLDFVAVVQQRQPRRQSGNGPFNDPFFNQMFNMTSAVPRQMTVHSKPVLLNVKPLPLAGQPANFSGAVGQFMMTEKAKPLTVNVGDPITVDIGIHGRGNFQRSGAPEMQPEKGWQTYPPSSHFKKDDDLGISGTKTFSIAVIPLEKKAELPPFEFSFFNPVTEKYVTLKSKEFPLNVSGASLTAKRSPAQPAAIATPSSTPKNSEDILYIQTAANGWSASFRPFYQRRTFWAWQAAPCAGLLAFIGLGLMVRRKRDRLLQQHLALLHERDSQFKMLKAETKTGPFFDTAVRTLHLDAMLANRERAAAADVAEICAARRIDSQTEENIRRIFSRHEALSYTGSIEKEQPLPADERAQVLKTVKNYEEAKSHV